MVGSNKPIGETPDGVLAPIVSHGRGGQGNIRADDTLYADGAITRQGVEGDQGDGAYSAGRGGIGNIGSPGVKPNSSTPHDRDIISPLAVRPDMEGDYHVGRGGHGNVSHEADRKAEDAKNSESKRPKETTAYDGSNKDGDEGLAHRLKNKIFGRK